MKRDLLLANTNLRLNVPLIGLQDLQWHHALQLTPEEAHLPQKTLHNFRARVVAQDGGRVAFEAMTDRILQALDTKVSRQRLDSTHVISNIAVLTRLGLFCGDPAGVSVRPQGRAPAAVWPGAGALCCGATARRMATPPPTTTRAPTKRYYQMLWIEGRLSMA